MVKITGEISPKNIKLDAFKASLGKRKTFEAEINSGGGSVALGRSMYQAISEHQGTTKAIVTGLAASAASYIAMAFDEVVMRPHAMIMIHNVRAGVEGDSDDLREVADQMEAFNKSMAQVYAKRTGLAQEKILEMMDAETYMDAQTAVDLGFADRIEGEEMKKPTARMVTNWSPLKIVDFYASLTNTEPMDNQELAKLKAENEALKAKNESLQAKFDELSAQMKAQEKVKIDAFVAKAVEEGKIKEEGKASLEAFAMADFEGAKTMLDNIGVTSKKPKNITNNIQENPKADEWTLAEYEKNDPQGLQNIYQNDKELFNQIKNRKKK